MGKNKTTRHITPKKFVLVVYDIVATITAALFSLFIYYEGTIPGKIIENFKNSWFIYPLVGFIIFIFWVSLIKCGLLQVLPSMS